MEEGEEADRRWRPWWSSPACGANGVPAAESGGGEADGVALGLANPTAATARPGVAASGYRSGGGEADGVALGLANPTAATARPGVAASGYRSGGGGEEGDGARAIEGTGELGEMGKKGQGIAGMVK
uniref:DUF834 domain-containing protein n=1 Tax=Oryza sativa subsp. japonica TaxID=39947 RepID=Q5N716_ORYSJ|nr:hypothetical protein [Oryza sativa Japonica Group]